MTTTFDAVYQDGVFRPATPPDLPDGTAVRLTVVPATPATPPDGRTAYEIIAAITARSVPPARPDAPPEDGSVNHDKYLYGGRGDRGDVR